MSQALRNSNSSLKIHSNDDSYAEDDFEQLESQGSRSHKFSPTHKSTQKKEELLNNNSNNNEDNYKQHINMEDHEEDDEEEEMSGDLEKYIMEMKIIPPGVGEDDGVDISKVMQSLDGIKPSSHDVSHKELEDKLGYQSRPLTDAVQPNGYNPVQKHQNQLPSVKDYISPTSKTDEEHTSPLHSRSTEEKRPPHKTKEEQVNEAMKVESLLMELFPDKYGPPKKKTKAKKSTSRHHELQSLAAGRLNLFTNEDEDDEEEVGQTKDVLSGLEGQLKLLKKDLKVKDEKIMKLTEHSMMMASHMDKLKGEIARLNVKLHEAEVELANKESRLAEALKQKKKAKKSSAGKSSPGGHHDKFHSELESENARLREREQALMEAVEELSGQNEDLIIKLRESMQRELELSHKRATLVSNNVLRENSSLPSINSSDRPPSGHRTHSEPSSDAPIKRKKKARSG